MTTARLAVSLPGNHSDDGQATFWLGVLAFGRVADSLARHRKGELVSVAGPLQANTWTGQDGSPQTGYQVIADSLISARTTRPGGGRQPAAAQAAGPSTGTPAGPEAQTGSAPTSPNDPNPF